MLNEHVLNIEVSNRYKISFWKLFGHFEGKNEDDIAKQIYKEKGNGLKGRLRKLRSNRDNENLTLKNKRQYRTLVWT